MGTKAHRATSFQRFRTSSSLRVTELALMRSTLTLVSATCTFSAAIGAMPCSAHSHGVLRLLLTLDSASRRGVVVTNTPDVLSDCVADLAIGLCVAIARKICMADAFVRSGAWLSGHSFPLGVKVSGKRMGLLGMGRIGQEIAARAAAFKMHVSYHSRRKSSVPFMYYDNLLDLAKNSDFLGKSNQVEASDAPRSPLQIFIISSLCAAHSCLSRHLPWRTIHISHCERSRSRRTWAERFSYQCCPGLRCR